MSINNFVSQHDLTKDGIDKRDFKIKTRGLPRTALCVIRGIPAIGEQKYSTCGPWAIRNMISMLTGQSGKKPKIISVSDLYWHSRDSLGLTPRDTGINLRQCFKTLHKKGALYDRSFPGERDFREKPPRFLRCRYRINGYRRIELGDIPTIQKLLYTGYPLVAGINIPYCIMEDPKFHYNGNVPEWVLNRQSYAHAVCIFGYDKNKFFFTNSWGKYWGAGGIGTLPTSYLDNEESCDSIWTLSTEDGKRFTGYG